MKLCNTLITCCSALLASVAASSLSRRQSEVDIVKPSVVNGTSSPTFTSLSYGFDGPKIKPINSSSWEWWYFDVVSEDAQSSVVVIFYTAPETGFVFAEAPTDNILEATLSVNVTGFDSLYLVNFAEKATIVTNGNGASGDWAGTGFNFQGSPDLKEYAITIDDKASGVKGSITYYSIAQPHYPCGCAEAGQNLEILPTVGWANSVPDAIGNVELDINGTSISFSGVGYHDKNWGTQSFIGAVGSWYWGHGRLGPYSIVWYDALSPNGTESTSAYVSVDDHIIVAACSGIKVRPLGGARYPPHAGDPSPEGFNIAIDLGTENGGLLVVNVTAEAQLIDNALYNRWSGKLIGGLEGQEQLTGSALYEEFQLFDL